MAATAVVGVLAIGGLPTLALTLADGETTADTTSVADTPRQPGPPPWAQGRAKGHHKQDRDDKDARKDKSDAGDNREGGDGVPGWARHGDHVPPGWARNHPGRSPHGWAMRAWAHCVADAAARLPEGETLDPERACGTRPAPPRLGQQQDDRGGRR